VSAQAHLLRRIWRHLSCLGGRGPATGDSMDRGAAFCQCSPRFPRPRCSSASCALLGILGFPGRQISSVFLDRCRAAGSTLERSAFQSSVSASIPPTIIGKPSQLPPSQASSKAPTCTCANLHWPPPPRPAQVECVANVAYRPLPRSRAYAVRTKTRARSAWMRREDEPLGALV